MCSSALIPIGLGLVSGQMQAKNDVRQAADQAAQLNLNAYFQDKAADDALDRGRKTADTYRVKTAGEIGSQRAAQAASGGVVEEGTFAQQTQDTAQYGELDALTIANNAAREAYGYKVQAATDRANAKRVKKYGAQAAQASILGGVLGGVGSAYSSGDIRLPSLAIGKKEAA